MKKNLLLLSLSVILFSGCDMLDGLFGKDDQEKEIPDVENAWTPIDGKQVSKIEWTNTKKSGSWTMTYDSQGRIKKAVAVSGSQTTTWSFSYKEASIVVGNGSTDYEFFLTEKGFTKEIAKGGTKIMTFDLDGIGRIESCEYLRGTMQSFTCTWNQGNLTAVRASSGGNTIAGSSTYTSVPNNTNIDISALAGDTWYTFETWLMSGGNTPFALFGLYGKSCENLMSRSGWYDSSRSFTYEYETEGCPKKMTSSSGEVFTFQYND